MSKLKKTIYKNKNLSKVVLPAYHKLNRVRNFSSQNYWEKRYQKGGNSGAGSYGRLAKFKAEVINDFAKKNHIKSVVEIGSGDGSQLKLFSFKQYVGLDVSKTSVKTCISKYSKDKTKSFFLYNHECFADNHGIFSADMTMSLDVIYHLTEDDTFRKYMTDLFSMSKKFVIIYSSNVDNPELSRAQHVRHREFTKWIKRNARDWSLIEHIPNKYALDSDLIDESPADFYIYKKTK